MSWPPKPITHGASRRGRRTPEYKVWVSMRRRCIDQNSLDYKNYGGRGISVCERWAVFANFLADMGPRPSSQHTIERVNNELGYSPDNCIWATRDIQARNRRARTPVLVCIRGHGLSGDNLYITPKGKRQCKTCRREALREMYRRLRRSKEQLNGDRLG